MNQGTTELTVAEKPQTAAQQKRKPLKPDKSGSLAVIKT